MQDIDRRRDIRVHVSPPAMIVRLGSVEPIEVLNASYRGVFVRTEGRVPQIGELHKLRIELPAATVELHGVPIRIVKDRFGRAGVGFRFFAMNGETKRLWESYIAGLLSAGEPVAA